MAISPNISEIFTASLQNYNAEVHDNISNNIPLFDWLRKKDNMKLEDGGTFIRENIEYAENSSFEWYSGYEVLNTNRSDIITAADFDWKQASVAIMMSGLEELQNQGSERIFSLLDARRKNAYKTMYNQMGAAVYLDGTQGDGRALQGLAALLSQTPSLGIVGGIDASLWSFWRNYVYSATVNLGVPLSANNIGIAFDNVITNTTRNNDGVDLIIAGSNIYSLLQQYLWTNTRFMPESSNKVNGGIRAIEYQGITVMNGGGVGSTMDPNIAYFLNTDYIKLRTHRNRNFEPLPFGKDRTSINQDAMINFIGWAGNMTITNRRLQGVLIP